MSLSNPLLIAKGINAQLELYENKVTIRYYVKRKGIMGFLLGVRKDFGSEKDVDVSQICSIQFLVPNVISGGAGCIRFVGPGDTEIKGGISNVAFAKDRNTVIFSVWQREPFIAVKEALEKILAAKGK